MRSPTISPPIVDLRRDNDMVTEIRRYKVITPLFGGGVKPGVADPITVVRGTEVRGHLRFWWRATRGGQFDGSCEKMKKAEELIWGSSGASGKPGPSDVSIFVSDIQPGSDRYQTQRSDRLIELGDPSSEYSYVAFPLRSERGKPAGNVRDNVGFSLTIRYCTSQFTDVAAALWAWETFGGIGARTRRGFGALQCISIDHVATTLPDSTTIAATIRSGLQQHLASGSWPTNVPSLLRDFRISPSTGKPNADEAWKHLFSRLKQFRQARFQNSIGKPYGRSTWPEPDAIRNLTGDRAEKHAKRRLAFDKFPRSVFGLPIIFQFKDNDLGDPGQTSLEGADHDRLASPLILRPLACAGGKYVGLAVILNAPTQPPGGLILKGAPGNPHVSSGLTPTEARQINVLGKNTDVLLAFLDSL